MSVELEDRARALLQTELDSFEKLEIARALRSGQSMSRAELEVACELSGEVVDDAVASLGRARMIVYEGPDRIRLGAIAGDPGFARLMQNYDEDRGRVLTALSSTVTQRIRAMAARAFAVAFGNRRRS